MGSKDSHAQSFPLSQSRNPESPSEVTPDSNLGSRLLSDIAEVSHQALRLSTHPFHELLDAKVADNPRLGLLSRTLMSVNKTAEGNRELRALITELGYLAPYLSNPELHSEGVSQLLGMVRQLLGSDISLLITFSSEAPDSVTSVELSSGVWTDDFQEIDFSEDEFFRTILETEAPLQTANYLHEYESELNEDIQSAFRKEGVRSLLGIPIYVEGELTHCLVAADRSERIFHVFDIFTLEQLALQGAALLDSPQPNHGMPQLNVSSEAASHHSLESTFVKLIQHISSGEPVRTTLADLSAQLKIRLETISQVEARQRRTAYPRDLIRALDELEIQPEKSPIYLSNSNRQQIILMNISMPGQPLEVLFAEGSTSQISKYDDLLNSISSLMKMQRKFGSDGPTRTEMEVEQLLSALIRIPGYDVSSRERALLEDKGFNFDLSDKYVALVEAPSLVRANLDGYDLRLETERLTMILLPAVKIPEFEDMLIKLKQARVSPRVGGTQVVISEPFKDIRDLHSQYSKVQQTISELQAAGISINSVVRLPYQIPLSLRFLSSMSIDELRTVVHDNLSGLMKLSSAKRNELTSTAQIFLESNCSIPKTADELDIHPNTARQRIERLNTLLGSGWNLGSRSLESHLALAAHRLLSKTRFSPETE